MFKFSVNSNLLYFPSNFLAFYIPVMLALQQLKISEICTLISVQIFCILMKILSVCNLTDQNGMHISDISIATFQVSREYKSNLDTVSN